MDFEVVPDASLSGVRGSKDWKSKQYAIFFGERYINAAHIDTNHLVVSVWNYKERFTAYPYFICEPTISDLAQLVTFQLIHELKALSPYCSVEPIVGILHRLSELYGDIYKCGQKGTIQWCVLDPVKIHRNLKNRREACLTQPLLKK